MKPILSLRRRWALWSAALFLSGFVCSNAADAPNPSKEDFSSVAAAVVQLLESGDAATFAKTLAPSIEDWRAVTTTNRNDAGEDPFGSAWQESLDQQRHELEASAKQLLAKAAELKVDFSRLRLTARVTTPRWLGSMRYGNVPIKGDSLPWVQKVEVVVTAEPLDADDARMGGEYKLWLKGLLKFPPGWRAVGSAQWVFLPASVVDEKTQREMGILAKVETRKPITQADDPALLQLGERVARFIRSGDVNVYESELMLSVDAAWRMFQRLAMASGEAVPAREQLEEQWTAARDSLIKPAQSMLDLMAGQGIDLQDAEIQVKEVALKHARQGGVAGTLEGLEGDQLTVKLTVQSAKQSGSGKGLSGDYVVAAEEALRLDGRWYVPGPVRWDSFPDGVVDHNTMANLQFESYVAEHGTLPSGTVAPDIEFVGVNDEQKGKLSDLRGKVVILDFWATWCGPCQEPMANMQKYRDENPDWKDRVAVVSLSIDDTIEAVRNHLTKRGWTNTFNVWAGEGGWAAGSAKAFRVSGVPTCYVIDAEGKIVEAGHPAAVHAPEVVNRLLK